MALTLAQDNKLSPYLTASKIEEDLVLYHKIREFLERMTMEFELEHQIYRTFQTNDLLKN